MSRTSDHTVGEWQEEYIDTGINHSKGLAERLWECCIELYSAALRIPEHENVIPRALQKKISRDFKILLLWGDGLRGPNGGLDQILQPSKRLRHETMHLLVHAGTKLQGMVQLWQLER